jgi:hypothetical protein
MFRRGSASDVSLKVSKHPRHTFKEFKYMGLVMRKEGGSTEAAKPTPAFLKKKPTSFAAQIEVSLPTAKSTPSDVLEDYTWLIHGEAKIGKTSLLSNFSDTLFLMFEPGGKGLSVFKVDIPDWRYFKAYVKKLQATSQFRHIVIDTVDVSYERVYEYIAEKNNWDVPPGDDYGRSSWIPIEKEMKSEFSKIIATGRGVSFTSHTKEGSFASRVGSYTKLIPTMPNMPREFLSAFVDIIAYYGYAGEERVLTIEGSDRVDAGHRILTHFRTLSGEKVHSIPMGDSAEEGYENIVKAFRNKQADVHKPKQKEMLSETKAMRKRSI